jgi:hypothetical protein
MEIIQELPQEIAGGQRKAPLEMLEEDHCFSRLGRGNPLATGRVAAHEILGRDYLTLAQQLDPPLLHPGSFPGSFGQRGRGVALAQCSALAFRSRYRRSHPGPDLDKWNGGGGSLEP